MGRAQVEGIVRDSEQASRILGVRMPSHEDEETDPWTRPASRCGKEPPNVGELPSLELVSSAC
jgi:hypothetical protein